MKRLIALVTMMIVVVAAAPADAGLAFKLKGGFSYISYSDFNEWVDESNSGLPSGTPTIDNLNWLPEMSAEVTLTLVPSISAGVGIGFLGGKSTYTVSIGAETFNYVHKLSSVPILFNIYWEPPLVSINPFVYGGAGLYPTNLDFEYKLTNNNNTVGFDSALDTWGFGLHAGGGIKIALMPKMSLDIGAQGRWAEITGFEGTTTLTNGDEVESYLAKDDDYFGPEEKGVGDEEGTVSLTGFTFFLGLSIGF